MLPNTVKVARKRKHHSIIIFENLTDGNKDSVPITIYL